MAKQKQIEKEALKINKYITMRWDEKYQKYLFQWTKFRTFA